MGTDQASFERLYMWKGKAHRPVYMGKGEKVGEGPQATSITAIKDDSKRWVIFNGR